jgi:hypothetical protein
MHCQCFLALKTVLKKFLLQEEFLGISTCQNVNIAMWKLLLLVLLDNQNVLITKIALKIDIQIRHAIGECTKKFEQKSLNEANFLSRAGGFPPGIDFWAAQAHSQTLQQQKSQYCRPLTISFYVTFPLFQV